MAATWRGSGNEFLHYMRPAGQRRHVVLYGLRGPYPPGGRPAPSPAPSPAGPSTGPGRRSTQWPLVAIVVVLLACGGTAAVLLRAHFSSSGHPVASQARVPASSATDSSSSPAESPAGDSSPPADQSSGSAEQVAAQALAALLTKSTSDRSSVQNAVADVSQCGNLAQDQQVFQNAVTSRQQLLSQLAALPDASALPGTMTQALASAWQASIQADQDFVGWAQDESSNGCSNSGSDSNYQAATGPDDQATANKTTFVNLWNPIAAQYELQTYQEDQL